MTIQILRLINGDEIIGILLEEGKKEYVLDTPMLVSEEVDPQTQMAIILLSKFSLFNPEQVVTIKKDQVITSSTVMPEMEEYYLNSLEYNSRVIEPNMITTIKKVNKTIRDYLDDAASVPVGDSTAPTSNSVH